MDVFEAIATTRAMRRLDPDRDVSDADLVKVVEAATKGPSGSNAQPARWLVVKDAEKRKQLGEVYRKCWDVVREMYKQTAPSETMNPILRSADHLGHHMGDAPAIIIPCAAGMPGQVEASLFGCIQNLSLAARALGLGTTLTTVHRIHEGEVKAILGIPDDVTTFAMIPIGYPLGRWGEAVRLPVAQVAYWDSWKNPPPA